MRRTLRLPALSIAALAATLPLPALAGQYVIEHVTLIDGTGAPARPDMTVAVDGDRITAVIPSGIAGTDLAGVRIDARGKYLMPGLMDVHIHLRSRLTGSILDTGGKPDMTVARQALASYLFDGVTTVFDAGNKADVILPLRNEERAGTLASPRIFATGNLITYPGSHGDALAVRISDFEKDKALVDAHIADQKPDLVKFTYDEEGWGARPMITLMPLAELQKLTQYYNQHGIRTTVHVSNEKRAEEAMSVGVDTLAHPVIQGPVSDDFVRLMGAKKTPFATTLTIGENYARLAEHPEYLDQPDYVASFSAREREYLQTTTRAEYQARSWTWWMKLMTPICMENIRKVVAGGGVAALGTDQSSGPAVHREMELLVKSGIPAAQVIRIATLNGAIFLGKEDQLGSVEAGKLADLLLLDADPLTDIDNARRITWVMKGGVIVDESKLALAGGAQPRRYAGPRSN
ncbi:amidohydrolase family protein [Novosphingobium sp. BL-52-GroH]|uniref:amidohydrolase family protein n=1 Tax=Novosphingobium sp. BL-52-GroH TaxID=3349877 RepID=UPI00384DE2EB